MLEQISGGHIQNVITILYSPAVVQLAPSFLLVSVADSSLHSGHSCAITAPISAWMQTDCRSISGGQTACP